MNLISCICKSIIVQILIQKETEEVKPEPLPLSIINKGDNPLPPSTISHHEQRKTLHLMVKNVL